MSTSFDVYSSIKPYSVLSGSKSPASPASTGPTTARIEQEAYYPEPQNPLIQEYDALNHRSHLIRDSGTVTFPAFLNSRVLASLRSAA